MTEKLIVSSSPHIRSEDTVFTIMRDVVVALIPAAVGAVILFGWRALMLMVVSIASCVGFEYLWQRIIGTKTTITDLSAVVTGLLLAMNVPVTLPYWMIIVGAFFAIIVVKQFFGGLGHNFMNPALAARAFMLTCWSSAMTYFVEPTNYLPVFSKVDAVSSVTPLMMMKLGEAVNASDMFWGRVGGSLGETSSALLLLGGIYLVYRKVISPTIPVSYLLTVFVLGSIVPGGFNMMSGLLHVIGGGVMFGAIFMATDYVSSPITNKGRIIAGVFCGVITIIMRQFGAYPAGVSYAILLMNIITPLINKFTKPKVYGVTK